MTEIGRVGYVLSHCGGEIVPVPDRVRVAALQPDVFFQGGSLFTARGPNIY